MTQEVAMWIFGFVIVAMGTIISAGVAIVFSMSQRLTRVETLVGAWNTKAAEILHSPHTPELDALLEKFVLSYKKQHYDLTDIEWFELLNKTSDIEKDMTLSKGERLLAGFINATCEHKLMRTPKLKQIERAKAI